MKCLMNGLEVNYPCFPACALFGDCVTAFEKQKKANVRTNADRIRAMSDEELAEVVAGLICISHCVVSCSCSECFLEKICGEDIGVVEVLDFLKQPVKDGKDK